MVVDIYCYYVGVDNNLLVQGKKAYHVGIAKTISEDGSVEVIRICFSTDPKWIPQDLGHKRKSNMVPFMNDYILSKKTYERKFGLMYRTVWLDSQEQFNQIIQKYGSARN